MSYDLKTPADHKTPLVSVILPTHNRPLMLREAIASVLRQTFTNWELVIIGDGAGDDTKAAVCEFNDPRIRYFRQERTGLPGARNMGIQVSRGRFVNLLDDDDAFFPSKLEHQLAFFAANPGLGLLAGGYCEADKFFNILREVRPWLGQPTFTIRDWLLACPFNPSTPLIDRTWIEKVSLFDPDMHGADDWDMFLRLAQNGCPMAWLKEPVCYYRFHGANMTQDATLINAGVFRMLEKFFAQPDLSTEIISLRELAYAHAHLGAAARAFADGQSSVGREHLHQAISLDATLLEGTPPRWLDSLAAFALTPLVKDRLAFAELIATNLPAELDSGRWTLRRIRGTILAVGAFDRYQQGKYADVVRYGVNTVRTDPTWLLNYGFCSVVARSLSRAF